MLDVWKNLQSTRLVEFRLAVDPDIDSFLDRVLLLGVEGGQRVDFDGPELHDRDAALALLHIFSLQLFRPLGTTCFPYLLTLLITWSTTLNTAPTLFLVFLSPCKLNP